MDSFIAVTSHFINDEYELKSILLECSVLMGHHSSQNLATTLQRIVMDWGIGEKVLLAVSDNASNIKNAITTQLGWNHLGCFAHTINLIVKDALSDPAVGNLLSKVRTVVGNFKRSSISTQKFIDYQKQTNPETEALKLIQDVPTRWNSTFYMLERFTKLENAVKSTTAILNNNNIPVLTAHEWQICKELCTVLRPFEKTTKTISGENYVTGSFIIPIVNGLFVVYATLNKKKFEDVVTKVVKQLYEGIGARLGQTEQSNTLAIATFFDPRFKAIGFQSASIAERTNKQIQSLVATKIELDQKNQVQAMVAEGVEEEEQDELSIWGTLRKNIASKSQPRNNATSKAIIEVQRYLEIDILARHEDPPKFWRQQHFNFPNLSSVAKERLCVLATSVPCERQFSKASQMITDRRNKLSPSKAEKLIFLNSNYNISIG
nr:unnamed protein product [Callosobruchus analis]